MKAKLIPGLVLVAIFLTGCAGAIERVRQAKDDEAKVLKAAVCAMSIGAYHRQNTSVERRALDVLCGGEWERPITADDVRTLRELSELFRQSE